jgi:hypothetical protein
MLSSNELPAPEAEVRYHFERCASNGITYLVTTRRLTELSPGQSRVALYGDLALNNRLLAWGRFASIWPYKSKRAQDALRSLSLYANGHIPTNAAWVVALTDVELAPNSAGIEILKGEMEQSGKPLRTENLPSSAARALIYYRAQRASKQQ